MKYLLNPDSLLKVTLCWCGYLNIHVWLNMCITFLYDKYTYLLLSAAIFLRYNHGICKSLYQLVTGSMIVVHVRILSFTIIAPHDFYCLIWLIQVLSDIYVPSYMVLYIQLYWVAYTCILFYTFWTVYKYFID